jgi:hypothetical protein
MLIQQSVAVFGWWMHPPCFLEQHSHLFAVAPLQGVAALQLCAAESAAWEFPDVFE